MWVAFFRFSAKFACGLAICSMFSSSSSRWSRYRTIRDKNIKSISTTLSLLECLHPDSWLSVHNRLTELSLFYLRGMHAIHEFQGDRTAVIFVNDFVNLYIKRLAILTCFTLRSFLPFFTPGKCW
ncbi:hypothetical protein CPB84DRAFT_1764651 [Gymnopilus junonius]|uniref:Uncharacterized protein n=1 Tax=Gymnopilus junonius TaxID=109634 RepID=A0A9P5TT35_GYMJU|nr:hypothetical protein CPB84DRAFT_1764651 [Gymnopilus junonius]